MPNPTTFSTLACPEWPIETVIAKAAEFGYNGLEWRGGAQGHVQPSMPLSHKAALRRLSADAGLFALAVTAYTSFVSEDPNERQANVDELRRYADLAAELGARYVRAFVGELPPGVDPVRMHGRIVECLEAAAEHARHNGVMIALEPHDHFVRSAAVAPILQRATHPALGVIWDIGNTYSAGEDPAEGFAILNQRLCYVQVKDGQGRGEDWRLTPLGSGEVPLKRAFEMLLAGGYAGAFSVEWERAWHLELDPPEAALPAALHVVQRLLVESQSVRTEASA